MYDDCTILVTGGTGSFGNAFISHLLSDHNPKEIVVLSRDEKKQHDMRIRLKDARVSFVIGDIRDSQQVGRAMQGVDYVFHAAALKQVPSCEFFPMEAVKTNVIGTNNVLEAANQCGVRKVVVLSTDKAVYPINAMGMAKALMEKLMLAQSKDRRQSSSFVRRAIRKRDVLAWFGDSPLCRTDQGGQTTDDHEPQNDPADAAAVGGGTFGQFCH